MFKIDFPVWVEGVGFAFDLGVRLKMGVGSLSKRPRLVIVLALE